VSTILCVEAEPRTGVVLERALGELGHRSVMTGRMDEALAAVRRRTFDLILSDHRLPDASGPDLLHALHEQRHELPVIIMTDYSRVEDAVASMRHGAIDYLTKPVRLEALRLAVNNAIEVVRLRRENEEYRRQIDERRRLIVGQNPSLRDVLDTIAAVARAGVTTEDPPESFNLTELERGAIRRALIATGGNRTRAARLLGISERTLRKKLNSGFLDGR
jgi:DNA-binding NtrC family response regulator